MPHTVTRLPGNGIGPEITEAAVAVIEATGVEILWDRHTLGIEAVRTGEEPLPKRVLNSIRKNRVALKGPLTTPGGTWSEMMLRHLDENRAADAVRRAAIQTLQSGTVLTPDLGGTATTAIFARAVASRVSGVAGESPNSLYVP